MNDDSQLEAEMRRALGLEVSETPAAQQRARRKHPVSYTLVELSVRRNGSGAPQKFVHRSSSIVRLVAQMEAEKAARKQGLEPWVVLDIRQVDDE